MNAIISRYDNDPGTTLLSQARQMLAEREAWSEARTRPQPIQRLELTGEQLFLTSRHSVRAFSSLRTASDRELGQILGLRSMLPVPLALRVGELGHIAQKRTTNFWS